MRDSVEVQVVQIGALAGDESGVFPPPRGVANHGAVGLADDGGAFHGRRFLGSDGLVWRQSGPRYYLPSRGA